MVSAVILTFIFTSGISLALRNNPPDQIKDEEFFGFLALVLLAGLLVAVLNCSFLLIYGHSKTDIPGPIYIVCFIYSFFACVNMGFQDALFAIGNIKFATFFDLTTVIVQISSLIFFVTIAQTSLIISVFISFIFSYTLICFATAAIFLNSLRLDFKLISSGMTKIIILSRSQHLFGIANGLVDRIDRFLIGLILPISFLAKYALLSSIISFARFLPDAAVKLDLLRHHQGRLKKDKVLRPSTIAGLIIAGAGFAILAQSFVTIVFGQAWLLPIYVGLLFVAQEILRGNYQITAIRLIALGGNSEMSKIAILLIILSTLFIGTGTFIFGIWAAPAAMILVYLILTTRMNILLKKLGKNVYHHS